MPRVRLDMGPTGTNRVSLDGQHLVRYWRAELTRRESPFDMATSYIGIGCRPIGPATFSAE